MDKQTATRFFRVVCPPGQEETVLALLQDEGFEFTPEGIWPLAYRLTHEPQPLGSSLAAFFGLIYIQDRSSMLPPLVLNPPQGAVVLDMCASPGSKTGLLSQLTGPDGLVAGNEPNPSRLANLRRNLEVLNLFSTVTVKGEGQALGFSPESFAYILLDPPCSGWGTAERHPKVTKLWQGEKIKPLIGLQRRLLAKAAQLLRPGGRLVYSTCTTNGAENEDQIVWAVEKLGLCPQTFVNPDGAGGELVSRVGIPGGQGDGQGFFVALFSKEGEPPSGPGLDPETARWSRFRENILPRECLDGPCLSAEKLPPGQVAGIGNTLLFLPEKAGSIFPPQISWRGFGLGRFNNGLVKPSPRLRGLMRAAEDCPALNVDEPEPIKRLLQGNSLNLQVHGKEAGLYYRGLALGILRVHNDRAVWSQPG